MSNIICKCEGDGRMLNLSLPFYGKRGSISKIFETEKNYSVTKYGINGKEELSLIIPKKYKNYVGLMQNYYQDLKGYLESTYHYYLECRSTRLKKEINIKKVQLGTCASIGGFAIGSILMTGFLSSAITEAMAYVGLVIAASSISGFCATRNLTKTYKKDKEKADFIERFNSLNRSLENYYRAFDQSKEQTPTKFNGLNKDKTVGNTLEKKKKKILESTRVMN